MSLVGDNKRNSNRLLANTGRTSLLLQHSLGRLLLISSLMVIHRGDKPTQWHEGVSNAFSLLVTLLKRTSLNVTKAKRNHIFRLLSKEVAYNSSSLPAAPSEGY
jgi:hypothetical protein